MTLTFRLVESRQTRHIWRC